MQTRKLGLIFLIPVLALAASTALAGQVASSMTRGVQSYMQFGGYEIRPAGTGTQNYDDLAPTQLFEVIRPNNQEFTIGRIFTSCTCVRLESDTRTFKAGQRAVFSLHNIQATPPAGQTYAIYIQITAPIKTMLRYDTFVQSSQFVPAPAGLQPTRGNIVADGVLPGDALLAASESGDIEVIVPKSENYVPDTSDYTLRKKAELAATASAAAKSGGADAAKKAAGDAAKETAKAEAKPAADPELRAAISSAVDTVEKNMDKQRQTAAAETAIRPQTRVREVQDKARAEAQAAARLASSAKATPAALQDEAKRIGESMLEIPVQTASATLRQANQPAAAAAAATTTVKPPERSAALREETAKLGRELSSPTRTVAPPAVKTTPRADDTWAELRDKSKTAKSRLTQENASGMTTKFLGRAAAERTQAGTSANSALSGIASAETAVKTATQNAATAAEAAGRSAADAFKSAVSQ